MEASSTAEEVAGNSWSFARRRMSFNRSATNASFSTPAGDRSNNGLKVGTGVQYDLTPTVALRGEYEYYHFHDAFSSKVNVGQFTAGVKVAF